MDLHYHGRLLLAPFTLDLVASAVRQGFAYWLEVEGSPDMLAHLEPLLTNSPAPRTAPSARRPPPRPPYFEVRRVLESNVDGFFLGLLNEHDRDAALHVFGARVETIHPFSMGRDRYPVEAIVDALLGSQNMRLAVLGHLGDIQRHHNNQAPVSESRMRQIEEQLLSTFRGGLEAARGAVRSEVA